MSRWMLMEEVLFASIHFLLSLCLLMENISAMYLYLLLLLLHRDISLRAGPILRYLILLLSKLLSAILPILLPRFLNGLLLTTASSSMRSCTSHRMIATAR